MPVSYLGNALGELIEKQGITQKDLASKAKVSPGHISNLVRGIQTWIDPADFSRICEVLSEDLTVQAGLLKAHLLDECEGHPAAHLLKISIQGTQAQPLREEPKKYRSVPADFQESIETLVQHHKDREVRAFVTSIAKMLDRPPDSCHSRH